MTTQSFSAENIGDFIDRWSASAAERASFQQFAVELCDLLGVPHPDPKEENEAANAYVFETPLPLPHEATGFIDLHKRGCFVLKAKQGSEQAAEQEIFSREAVRRFKSRKRGTAVRGTASWYTAMERAHQQAQSYAHDLLLEEIEGGRPPFLVVDVGNTIALYGEFSRTTRIADQQVVERAKS